MKILITGAAGFIGFHLSHRLQTDGWEVIGIDNLNDYYDVSLKEDRLRILAGSPGFSFHRLDLTDGVSLMGLFNNYGIDQTVPVVHLAAQAGVRYGLKNPGAYIQSNIVGFFNILEACRTARVPHLLYASSSSVYGGNRKLPFSTDDNVDHPVSLYAATKKSNELLAHVYSYTYDLPTTGLRFFTVYGPWGRPDMAYFSFTKAILEGKPIKVFNYGNMQRDFTYIDDVVEGIVRAIGRPAVGQRSWEDHPKAGSSWVPYRVYNIGNNKPELLLEFISVIEDALGCKAIIEMHPLQTGDVEATYADIDDLRLEVGFVPETSIREGIPKFIRWFREYYGYPKE